MNSTIGIIGFGWLGTPLGKMLLNKRYQVRGSTTSDDKLIQLSNQGFLPFKVELHESGINGDIDELLSHLDILIINVPPNLRKNPKGNYVDKIKNLKKACLKAQIKKILFVSSTSVYGTVEGDITEETVPNPKTNSGQQLLEAENLFLKDEHFQTTILRLGGLIGGDRHPIYQLSNKEFKNGEELVNLIHQDDAIHMVATIIKNGYWNEVFNGVYPYHPKKSDYYASEAKKRGVPPPVFIPNKIERPKKRIIFRNFYVKGHELTTSISS